MPNCQHKRLQTKKSQYMSELNNNDDESFKHYHHLLKKIERQKIIISSFIKCNITFFMHCFSFYTSTFEINENNIDNII